MQFYKFNDFIGIMKEGKHVRFNHFVPEHMRASEAYLMLRGIEKKGSKFNVYGYSNEFNTITVKCDPEYEESVRGFLKECFSGQNRFVSDILYRKLPLVTSF